MKKKYATGILAIFCLSSLINATIVFGQTSPNQGFTTNPGVGSSVMSNPYNTTTYRTIGKSGGSTYRTVLYFNLNSGLPPANCILKAVSLVYWSTNYSVGGATKVVALQTYEIGNTSIPTWYNTVKNSTPVIWSDKWFSQSQNTFSSSPSSPTSERQLWNQVQSALSKTSGNKYLSLGISMVDESQVASFDVSMQLVLIYEMHYNVTVKNSYTTSTTSDNIIFVDKNDNNGFQPYPSGTEFNLLLNQNVQIKTNTPVTFGEVTYDFANWSNNPSNLKTQNPYTLKVTKGETWTATFNERVNVSFWNKENTANLTNSQLLLDEVDQLTSGDTRSLAENTPHTVRTLNETWDNNRIKHNNWNNNPSEYKLSHGITVLKNTPIDVAQFKELKPVTVSPTIKGVPVSGPVEFNDPWFVESDGTQPGNWKTYSSGLNASTLPKGGVFLNQSYNSTNPYYKIRTTQTAVLAGLDGTFQNWSSSNNNVTNTTSLETPVVFKAPNDVVYANYGAQLVSAQGPWVQSVTPYTANGTRAVAYFSPDPNGDTGIWFHQENGSIGTELNISSDGFISLASATSLVSLAVADYNKQKSYVGYFAIENGYRILSIREIVNGVETGFTQTWATGNNYNEDPMLSNFSSNAKLYITPYYYYEGYPVNYSRFLIVVVDGLTVYTREGNLSNESVIDYWEPWSSFTVNETPVFSSNGKGAYINWLQNGNLVGRRYFKTSWGSTYTLYSNTGGNFINFSATVNNTDDLILMMTRQNGLNSRSMCFGKRYFSGNSAPINVLETQNFTFYKAYSLASENGKILASISKSYDGEDTFYYLWKNDGTNWIKETAAFSSTPARLLHNEVDVLPYEFVTATTPALYALKTSPVSWPGGAQLNKTSSESNEAEFILENKISVFPNPFNPTTVFSVSVAEPSTVKLHVFNLIGQQIAEVVNADLNTGVHDYRLNAGSWSSGTYFYRLQIGDKMQTGKIHLVK